MSKLSMITICSSSAPIGLWPLRIDLPINVSELGAAACTQKVAIPRMAVDI
jgi:hypothetical protein